MDLQQITRRLKAIVRPLYTAWQQRWSPFALYPLARYRFHQLSFAQFGEDRMLSDFFKGQKRGFYVDIGAHDPRRLSNTYLFYLMGWRGLVIDPLPGMQQRFRAVRPRDTALELGVAAERGTLTYYRFSNAAISTLDPAVAEEWVQQHGKTLLDTRPVPTLPLREILAEHLPAGQTIDLLCVDTEGLDEIVLQSNDWQRYRPRLVLVETHEPLAAFCGELAAAPAVHRLMVSLGYELTARTSVNSLYRDMTAG
jgi:FkbM family methyltransferase